MRIWLIADIVLVLMLVPCAWVILRSRDLRDWLVALQLCGTLAVLILLLLAQAMSRPSFYDLALALALLSYPAGLLFAHWIEHWSQ